MWFKQVQIFQILHSFNYDAEKIAGQLQSLVFTKCLPTLPFSAGWVSPMEDEQEPLLHVSNGYLLMCLQMEEKILPATVVRHELKQKIKEIEARYDRKVSSKEKYALKDEVVHTLLPRAFSKLSRTYAYIDTKKHWLVIDTASTTKMEKLLEILAKSIPEITLQSIATPKLAPMLTRWLLHQDYPQTFAVEKSCVLTDPNRKNRMIRCQQQDLFVNSIQSFIKDNCEVKQLALSWQDRVHFVLAEDFTLRSIKFHDEIIAQAQEAEPETAQQHFIADFFIMSETLSPLLTDLLDCPQD